MTRPTVIYFGPDGSKSEGIIDRPKIFLRGLLVSSSKRGRLVEGLYASIQHKESTQNFSVWVYGDSDLKRGSGLYVGENGMVTNHHFLLPDRSRSFVFSAGEYQLNVFANILGDAKATQLLSERLVVSDSDAASLSTGLCGLYFDWGPLEKKYSSKIDDSATKSAVSLNAPL